MADELIQQLGFDASAALDALAKMDTAFINFGSRLSSVAESMEVWNACARDTVQMLKEIASGAAAASTAMSKLSGLGPRRRFLVSQHPGVLCLRLLRLRPPHRLHRLLTASRSRKRLKRLSCSWCLGRR